jgi:hypothetical protein
VSLFLCERFSANQADVAVFTLIDASDIRKPKAGENKVIV